MTNIKYIICLIYVVIFFTIIWCNFHFELKNSVIPVHYPNTKNRSTRYENNNHTKTPVLRRQHYLTGKKLGRLGNNMFEYAAIVGISAKTGHIPLVTEHQYLRNIFNIETPPTIKYKGIKFVTYKEHWGKALADETIVNITNMRNMSVKLRGFFESRRYFDNAKDRLRKEYTFKEPLKSQALSKLKEILHVTSFDNVTTVGIHVRIGDFAGKASGLRKSGWILPPITYFHKAMSYLRQKYKNTRFLICSDSKKWVTTNLPPNKTNGIFLSNERNGMMDFAMLSSCDHMIISRGTFSWWAGWLVHGETIYYTQYHPEGSIGAQYHPKWSYIPEDDQYNHWIPIDQ